MEQEAHSPEEHRNVFLSVRGPGCTAVSSLFHMDESWCGPGSLASSSEDVLSHSSPSTKLRRFASGGEAYLLETSFRPGSVTLRFPWRLVRPVTGLAFQHRDVIYLHS